MATTMLLPRHAGKGKTITAAIRDCLDYGKNPEKIEGKYISGYECAPATVAEEFLLAKASYKAATEREQKKEHRYHSQKAISYPAISLRFNSSVLNTHDPVGKLSDFVIMGNHHKRLIKLTAGAPE